VATDELMSHRSSRMSRHPLCSSPRATYGRTADSGVPGGNLSADAHQRHREANARDHYLELLKRALLGELSAPADNLVPIGRARRAHKRALQRGLGRRGIVLARSVKEERTERLEGRIWPLEAVTMIGRARLDDLQYCVEDVVAREVPGDCIETGVWRGGASMLMRGVLNAHGAHDRKVWLADSFAGLPPPDPRYPADAGGTFHLQPRLAVSLDEVQANFERYGLLDEGVVFLKGWFADTLPRTRHVVWSVIRLDGDMYQSTMDALTNLYSQLAVGGWVIVDDYCIPACRQAVTDFRQDHAISEQLHEVDWTAVRWRRER
jgi:O-methyltransferase